MDNLSNVQRFHGRCNFVIKINSFDIFNEKYLNFYSVKIFNTGYGLAFHFTDKLSTCNLINSSTIHSYRF
jgi:hypothetical protein